jgi:hypothetical protein
MTISRLQVEPYEADSLKLMWNGIGPSTSEYLIYRYGKPITDTQKLALATFVDRVKADSTGYIDKNPGPGDHYYAVLVRLADASIDNTLKPGANYTLTPARVRPEMRKAAPVKKRPEIFPEKKEEPVFTSTDTVDAVLKETFFRDQYAPAIKKLNNIITASDNEHEVAKAKLFIGRSLVELGRYRQSLRYFTMADVARHFPGESRFWREYAISRIR